MNTDVNQLSLSSILDDIYCNSYNLESSFELVFFVLIVTFYLTFIILSSGNLFLQNTS